MVFAIEASFFPSCSLREADDRDCFGSDCGKDHHRGAVSEMAYGF
jgi:hypothetical protein